jgi:hypothetical protein
MSPDGGDMLAASTLTHNTFLLAQGGRMQMPSIKQMGMRVEGIYFVRDDDAGKPTRNRTMRSMRIGWWGSEGSATVAQLVARHVREIRPSAL